MTEPSKKRVKNWALMLALIIAIFAVLAGTLILKDIKKNRGILTALKTLEGGATENILSPSLALKLLGFDSQKKYLALFLNNAEIRPGGGFIGSYATFLIEKGKISELKVDGSENVGREFAGAEYSEIAPPQIKKYLGQDKWYFRDANWSPDFKESAEKALKFYKEQSGDSSDFYGVVGFTPELLEEILNVTGPIVVDGIEFNSANAVEVLQYEVEFGFMDRGEKVEQRKKILSDLALEIGTRIKNTPAYKWPGLWSAWKKVITEKNAFLYVKDSVDEAELEKLGWAGRVSNIQNSDYMLVVDSNLGSLKSDPAVEREYDYRIFKGDGVWKAELKIKYNHVGKFDWKTTKYISYTRIYANFYSEFLNAKGFDSDLEKGVELNRFFVGGALSVAPGKTREIDLIFNLAPEVAVMLEAGEYRLFFQKQLGTGGINALVTVQGEREIQERFILSDDRKIRIKL